VHRFSFGLFIPAFFFFAVINWSCNKINTTSIGQDLIPAVDNVSTFADTLDINTTQGVFFDSTRISSIDNNTLGSITNDPIFGTTKADVFVELKPPFFPYYFGNAGDTIDPVINPAPDKSGFDSLVLCLSFKSLYGDTTMKHSFNVYKIDKDATDFRNFSYKLDYQPAIVPGSIGFAEILPTEVRNIIRFPGSRKDTVTNQIRIKLNQSFLNEFVSSLDTSVNSTSIFRSDSLYKNLLRGFAIKAGELPGSNALFYVDLNSTNTRLEVHYKKRRNAILDTTFSSLYFSTNSSASVSSSGHANYLKRDSSQAEFIKSPAADALYRQTGPGTFATLKIPQLNNFPNSIIHKAEIIVEQIPASTPALAALDRALTPPQYLYIDLLDTVLPIRYKPIYFDLNPTVPYNPDNSLFFLPSGGIDFGYFGGFIQRKNDALGNSIFYYSFNVSRYVQNMVTNRTNNYTLRLYAPYNLNYYNTVIPFNNNLANGRVKVGSGSNVNYKLRLRIIYSKI